jgi:hypothetical protein
VIFTPCSSISGVMAGPIGSLSSIASRKRSGFPGRLSKPPRHQNLLLMRSRHPPCQAPILSLLGNRKFQNKCGIGFIFPSV